MMKGKLTKRLTAGTVVLGVALVASVAFAAWTATGSGSGYTKATTASALDTVDVSNTTTAQLYPGGTSDVKISIHNPNPYPVLVTSVAAVTPSGADVSSDKGVNCQGLATGVTFATQTVSISVGAGATVSQTLSGAASMSNASDNSCQGAVFTIPVTLSGASNA